MGDRARALQMSEDASLEGGENDGENTDEANTLTDMLAGKLGWALVAVFLVGLAVLVFLAAK
jgi:hypothetical protein